MGMPRRTADGTGGVSQGEPDMSGQIDANTPLLAEFLAKGKWPDGIPRETGTLVVLTQDGVWKACLNCKDTDVTAWIAAGTLGSLLEAVEAGLEGSTLVWRQSKPPPGRRPTGQR